MHEKKTEMTMEKLQMVATVVVDAKFKVRWLKWWNASPRRRENLRFPKSPCSELDLEPFLRQAAWWAGVRTISMRIF